MDFKEACHRLRITPTLLKWFASYAPKSDGRKLRQQSGGNFDAAELNAFDAHLCAAWSSKNVPAGIEVELYVEACGHCGLCGNPCEKLEMAHIERKNVEVLHYFQHPKNLIPLCGSCHNRYDDLNLKAVSLEVIRRAKDRLISRKMESIDRDVERASAVRAAVEGAKAELSTKLFALTGSAPNNQLLWSAGAVDLLSAATLGVFGAPQTVPGISLGSSSSSLAALSGSIGNVGTNQVTQAVLNGYAQEASGDVASAPPDWEMIESKDDRTICELCDPGEDRPPALVNYDSGGFDSPVSISIDAGYCDWCNGISIRCKHCGTVRGVHEVDYGSVLECEGGCGLRFVVKCDYDPREGDGTAYVEVVSGDEDVGGAEAS